MRKEFVYSLAALGAIPVTANADTQAYKAQAVQTITDADVTLAVGELVKGKYTLTGDAITIANAANTDRLEVQVLAGSVVKGSGTVKNGEAISVDFELTEATNISVVLKKIDGKTITVPAPQITLVFDFAKVAELLQIEYNKLTQALESYSYEDKSQDIADATVFYDRIIAIKTADYAYFKTETEGLKDLTDQTNVIGLGLYTEITNALANAKNKEKTYQTNNLDGGNDGLTGLDTRYTSLQSDFEISYITTDLTNKKNAAKNAFAAYTANDGDTAENLTAAQNAVAAYQAAIEARETVKTANEAANTSLKAELAKVYGNDDSYYAQSASKINETYTERYSDLKGEVTAALAELVADAATSEFKKTQTAVKDAYTAITSDSKKNDLINTIAEFKEQITRVVSEYNGYKDQIAAAYEIYDAQVAANDVAAEAVIPDLASYATDVTTALNDLKTFIEGNDKKASVENLTETALNEKVAAITTAANTLSAKKAIYNDYLSLKDAVNAKGTALTAAGTAIDNYAKTTKKLPEGTYKPTTIWNTTIAAIQDQIATALNGVEDNKADATNYKTKAAYTGALTNIQSAIDAYQQNANAATDIYATIDSQIKAANTLKTTLNGADLNLNALNVWTNQVTTDEAIKARTPYNTVINTTIAGQITNWENELATAIGKTGKFEGNANQKKNNILGYLQDKAPAPADVLKDEIATLNAIQTNYESDEAAFAAQIEAQEVAGLATMINGKAEVQESKIAVLQTRINNGEFGQVKGAQLKSEIDGITEKINTAKAAAAATDATSAGLTEQYNIIKSLDAEITTAETHADSYATAFADFSGRYNTLNGAATDAATAQTVNGLKAKAKAEKNTIKNLAKLSADQKAAFQGNVDGVSVKKTEGENEVTYTIASIGTFIENAMNTETLTDAEVSKYQGIIDELKAETEKVTAQATKMNALEGLLAEIDFATAKTAVLAKDPNEDGFYYKQLTVDYQNDFNTLKNKIEADTDITNAEYNSGSGSYVTSITTLKNNVNGVAAKAEANLNWYNTAKAYQAKTKNHAYTNAEQWYGLAEAIAKLGSDDYKSSIQAEQLTTMQSFNDVLAGLDTDIENVYNNGTYNNNTVDYAQARTNINNYLEECTNAVNYNAQVAKDNKAIYDAITAAHEDATAAYQVASATINSYKNLKSDELKGATEQAQNELDALTNYLFDFEANASDIQNRADNEYGQTVSPVHFDENEGFKGEFEALTAEINSLNTAFLDKIKAFTSQTVSSAITTYESAINTSKAKVATFSATDTDLTEAQLNAIYSDIDDLLTAITEANEADNLKELDNALLAAADATNGINVKITKAEQAQAIVALTALRDAIDSPTDNLTGSDRTKYNTINNQITNAQRNVATSLRNVVNRFDEYKTDLKALKEKAAQNAADSAAKNAATAAINTATEDLADAKTAADGLAAGVKVKEQIDAIDAAIKALPAVTAANAEDVKAQAEAISADVAAAIEALYDAEVEEIESIIKNAKAEQLTYAATASETDANSYKTRITNEDTALATVKANVASAATAANHLTKEQALTNLGTIEANLNAIVNELSTVNETNQNAEIAADLTSQKNALQTSLDRAYNGINSNVDLTSLDTEKANIQTAITELEAYITTHAADMKVYKEGAEAKIADIESAIAQLKAKAQQLQDEYNQGIEEQAQQNLTTTWNSIQASIDEAKGKISAMETELGAYGSASNYANKVAKLNQQITTAEETLNTAKTNAEAETTTARKQAIANAAQTQVTNDLNGVANNTTDITALAKAAYINEKIEAMTAELNAISWDANNYTNTDATALNSKKNDIAADINTLKNSAESKLYANDYLVGRNTVKGVINTLKEGKAAFDTAVAELKQMIKDMSLEEDARGHITGGETIEAADIQALASMIANQQEGDADLSRCDLNGDGKVTVTDIIWLQYFWAFNEWPDAANAAPSRSGSSDAVSMEVVSTENNVTRVAVNLSNSDAYRAFQIGMQLPAGAKVVGQSLGSRVESGYLMHSENTEGSVRFMNIAGMGSEYAGSEGAVLCVDIENLNGEIELTEAYFTNTRLMEADLTATGGTTGIMSTISNALETAGQTIYNMGGKVMNSLKKGINIIRNSDGSSKKVVVK